jgi:hypothetical protein
MTNTKNRKCATNVCVVPSSSPSSSRISKPKATTVPTKMILVQLLLLSVTLQIQQITGSFIDMDTPIDKRTTASFVDGTEYQLVRIVIRHLRF